MNSNNYLMSQLAQLEYILQNYPNCWAFVSLKHLNKEHHITIEDLITLNQMLIVVEPDNLGQPMKTHYQHLGNSYKFGFKKYCQQQQEMFAQQQQQQLYFYQNQNQYQYQYQYQNQNQNQSQYPNQNQPQFYQNQPQYQNQNQNQGQNQNQPQPQSQSQYQTQPQSQYQYQGQGQIQYQNQPQYQYQNQPQYQNQYYQNYQNNYYQESYYQQASSNQYSQGGNLQESKNSENEVLINQEERKSLNETAPLKEDKIQILKPKKFSIDEIKNMVKNADLNELKKVVDEKTMKEVDQIKGWKRSLKTIDAPAQQPKLTKRTSNYPQKKETKQATEFNIGGKHKDVKNTFDIRMGANQTLETRIERKNLRQKAAERNYAKQKEKEMLSMNEIEQGKIDIIFNLNKIAPDNLKQIFKDVESYATQHQEMCEIFIDLIIEKAWTQPKYAGSYAKLCQNFVAKLKDTNFKFTLEENKEMKEEDEKGEKKDEKKKSNQFKQILLEKVQESFMDKDDTEDEIDVKNDEEVKEYKKKLFGHAEFTAELIKAKVIQKRIIRNCIGHFLKKFLVNHFHFVKTKEEKYSIYHLQFEALIRFIQNLGQRFQSISQQNKGNKAKYLQCEKWVSQFCEANKIPSDTEDIFNLSSQLTVDEYFKLFILIDMKILKQKETRLSFLLKNLQERKQKKWEKHHVEAQGPKKLKDIKKDEELQPEQKTKYTTEETEKEMKNVLKNFDEDGKSWKKDLQIMTAKYDLAHVYIAYLKLVAEESKEKVLKRFQLFSYLLENGFQTNKFYTAWKDGIASIAYLSSDMPFISALLAKILLQINAKKNLRWDEYYLKFDEEEEEEEKYFMELVYQKAYYYCQIKEILEFVEPKKGLTKML